MSYKDFHSQSEIIKRFSYGNDTDLYIQNIGYHNFDYIKPIKWMHRQLGYTIHFVLEGSGYLHLRDKEYPITKNQMFFIGPNEDHMYYPSEKDKWKYIWLYFNGNRSMQIAESMGFSVSKPVLNAKNHEKIEKLFTELITDGEKGHINEFKAKGAFYAIAGELSAYDNCEQFTRSCADEAAKLLATNFAKSDFSLETLCSMLYVSHSALCRAFKETFNMTPLKYLISIRMQNAAKLLVKSNFSVRDIAERSGYKDEIHFMKTFKNYYGITATEYRKNMIEKKGL